MNKIGFKAGLTALLIGGLLLLTNIAFAMCPKGSAQADPNKKAACSCCCCDCCK
jgi:hypothetical protein